MYLECQLKELVQQNQQKELVQQNPVKIGGACHLVDADMWPYMAFYANQWSSANHDDQESTHCYGHAEAEGILHWRGCYLQV